MQVSETFAKVVGVCIAVTLIIAAILFVNAVINPTSRVSAQGAGTVGITTNEILALNAVLNGVSSILPDNSYGAHYLRYCPSGWNGTISFEWAPNGVASNFYVPLQMALVPVADSQCHTLQLGGFLPKLPAAAKKLSANGTNTPTDTPSPA